MGPVELVGVVRLTRLWAEDVRLQAVLMTVAVAWLASPDCETPHQYTVGSSQTTIITTTANNWQTVTNNIAREICKEKVDCCVSK